MHATPMTRRQVLTATAGVVGAAMTGGLPRRSYARQGAVTLRWWDYYSQGANNEATQNQLQRYMDANPNVTIERTAIPFADLKQKLLWPLVGKTWDWVKGEKNENVAPLTSLATHLLGE